MAATTIGTWYGPAAGPTSKFRVVSQLRYTDTKDTGRFIQKRQYVEVTAGASFTWVSILQVSWTNVRYALGDKGIYADTGWKDVGWVNYGSTIDYGCSAEYMGGSGKLYKSELTGKYTLPVGSFTISFKANGGTGAPAAVKKAYGVDVKIPDKVPTRKGYAFRGWAKTADGEAAYQPGATISENVSMVLYAVWSAQQSCMIKVDGQYKQGIIHVKTNGAYKTGTVLHKSNGTYIDTGGNR